MDRGQYKIISFEWDPLHGEWRYKLATSEDDPSPFFFAVRGEGKKPTLLLWQGDLDDPTNVLVAQSDPIDLYREKSRDDFYATVVDLFGPLPWFREVLTYIGRNHYAEVEKEKSRRHEEKLQEHTAYQHISGTPYYITRDGFLMDVQRHGVPELEVISNFTARVLEELVLDDGGGSEERFYKIEARLEGGARTFEIPATAFDRMRWVRARLPVRADYYNKTHVRRAIQAASTDAPEVRAFTHTGWRLINGRWGYVHAGGVIFGFVGMCPGDGCQGCQDCRPFEGRVALRGKLARRMFPSPTNDAKLREAVRQSFAPWELAEEGVTVPLNAVAKRAALGRVDFNVHLSGRTGLGKTALALLALSYFGAGLREEDTVSFESTPNAIEAETFLLQDQLHVLDDYLATPEHKRILARIGRTAANNTGRARSRADGTLAGERPPRALVLSTGEDVPAGESLTARTLVLQVPESGGVNFGPDAPVNRCQTAAREGIYARAMGGYVGWLAPQYGEIRNRFEDERAALRREVWNFAQHARTLNVYADLMLGLRYWLDYARDINAIDDEEYEQRYERGKRAILRAVGAQVTLQEAQNPLRRFSVLLKEALSSGHAHLVHLETSNGRPKKDPERWGWRKVSKGYEPQGESLGWVLPDGLYLKPDASLRMAKEVARREGEPLVISQRDLDRGLFDAGWLVATDLKKARGTYTVRRRISSKDGAFLCVKREYLYL